VWQRVKCGDLGAIHVRRGRKRPAEQVDGHVVKECGEPDTLPSCGLTYAVQCGGYAFPALRLARAAPDRIALGPPLPSIASAAASAALFGDFIGTMGESDFL
jgi:hypothetical protein